MEWGWLTAVMDSVLKVAPSGVRTYFDERRQKARLKRMLTDEGYKFRSTERLMNGIGADRATTERLLLVIGARRSETSDEWTLNPPPTKR